VGKYKFLHALVAKLEDAVNPSLVRVETSSGGIHLLHCDMIMWHIDHDFENCSAEIRNIIQDAVTPRWLINRRDMRWASTHGVET
jgi:hypothetical protein